MTQQLHTCMRARDMSRIKIPRHGHAIPIGTMSCGEEDQHMQTAEVVGTARHLFSAIGKLQEACSHMTGCRLGTPSYGSPAALGYGAATMPWKPLVWPMLCQHPTALAQTWLQLNSPNTPRIPAQMQVMLTDSGQTVWPFYLDISSIHSNRLCTALLHYTLLPPPVRYSTHSSSNSNMPLQRLQGQPSTLPLSHPRPCPLDLLDQLLLPLVPLSITSKPLLSGTAMIAVIVARVRWLHGSMAAE